MLGVGEDPDRGGPADLFGCGGAQGGEVAGDVVDGGFERGGVGGGGDRGDPGGAVEVVIDPHPAPFGGLRGPLGGQARSWRMTAACTHRRIRRSDIFAANGARWAST